VINPKTGVGKYVMAPPGFIPGPIPIPNQIPVLVSGDEPDSAALISALMHEVREQRELISELRTELSAMEMKQDAKEKEEEEEKDDEEVENHHSKKRATEICDFQSDHGSKRLKHEVGDDNGLVQGLEDDQCGICFEVMYPLREKSHALEKLGSCGHIFHSQCLRTCSAMWKTVCPLCKVQYSIRRELPPARATLRERCCNRNRSKSKSKSKANENTANMSPILQ